MQRLLVAAKLLIKMRKQGTRLAGRRLRIGQPKELLCLAPQPLCGTEAACRDREGRAITVPLSPGFDAAQTLAGVERFERGINGNQALGEPLVQNSRQERCRLLALPGAVKGTRQRAPGGSFI